MLYSLSWQCRMGQSVGTERRMFYADNEEMAKKITQKYAERRNFPIDIFTITKHPRGFTVGHRFYPPEEPKKDE
jgi:hypothetical protein